MFTIKLEALPHPPDVTIDRSEAKGQNSTERLELEQKAKDKSKRLEQVKREREMVEDELRKLKERRIILVEEERSGAKEMRVLSGRQAEAEEQQEQASKRWSHSRKRWDDLYYIDYDEDGYGLEGTDGGALLHLAAKNGYVEMVKLLLDKGADITVAIDGWTPLIAELAEESPAVPGKDIRFLAR
ncbi:hypothetical protein QBC43DRAFT_294926 [Cladorrhinum sp. PSN259]|nr:hypothetical protein QBC43DRAFT_294926 [Cladorrhinum sp. PSN259]